MIHKKGRSLRSYLLGLVAVALIPALGVGAATAYLMLRDLRSSFEARLTESADAVAIALDRQIETRRVALDTLSRAVKLDPLAALMAPDMRTHQRLAVLHTTAQYVAESLGDPVALFLPDGTVLFRSDVPFGDEAPPLLGDEELRRAVVTKAPIVGDLHRDATRLLAPLFVPVVRDSEVVAVLGTHVGIRHLSAMLADMRPSNAAFISVVDGAGRVVASVPEDQTSRSTGEPVRDWQQQAIRNNPEGGLAQGTSPLGSPVIAAIQPIPTTYGWTVAVAAPLNTYEALQRRPMFWLALGGGMVFLLSLAAALYLADRLVRPVVALTRHARELLTLSQKQRVALARTERATPSPVTEIDSLREAIDRANGVQALLAREVDHRSKNLLAVVLSVVRLSRADDIDQFVEAVTKRVNALARAHSLLAQKGWEGADLMSVAGQELAAYAHRVTLRGPAVSLAAKVVQPLSMLLHELSTNAATYGALSEPEGQVELKWLLDTSDDTLHVRWREEGGPKIVQPPTHRGFGIRVIDATALQLGGTVQRRWLSSGLSCEMRLPIHRILRSGEQEQPAERMAVGSATMASGHA